MDGGLKATVNTLERIFTQNTSNDVVPGKEVPIGVSMTMIDICIPLNFRIPINFRKTAISGTNFDWTYAVCIFMYRP